MGFEPGPSRSSPVGPTTTETPGSPTALLEQVERVLDAVPFTSSALAFPNRRLERAFQEKQVNGVVRAAQTCCFTELLIQGAMVANVARHMRQIQWQVLLFFVAPPAALLLSILYFINADRRTYGTYRTAVNVLTRIAVTALYIRLRSGLPWEYEEASGTVASLWLYVDAMIVRSLAGLLVTLGIGLRLPFWYHLASQAGMLALMFRDNATYCQSKVLPLSGLHTLESAMWGLLSPTSRVAIAVPTPWAHTPVTLAHGMSHSTCAQHLATWQVIGSVGVTIVLLLWERDERRGFLERAGVTWSLPWAQGTPLHRQTLAPSLETYYVLQSVTVDHVVRLSVLVIQLGGAALALQMALLRP